MTPKKKSSIFPLVFSILTVIAILLGSIDWFVYAKYYRSGKFYKMRHPAEKLDMTDPDESTDFGRIYYSPIDEEHMVEEEHGFGYIDNEICIVSAEGATREEIADLAAKYDAEIVGEIEVSGDYQLRLTTTLDDLGSVIASIAAESAVESAYPNYVATVSASDGDVGDFRFGWSWEDDLEDYNDMEGLSWGFEAINTVGAWNLLANSDSVVPVRVGVHDSGLNPDHVDLGFAGYYYENGVNRIRTNRSGARNHGTHVSGTFAANADNDIGICGVYPYGNGRLYGVSNNGITHFSENGSFFTCIMSEKVAFAELIVRNVKVINQSLGFNYYSNDFGEWDSDGNLHVDSVGLEAFWNNSDSHSVIAERSDYLGDFFKRMIQNGYDFVIVSAAGNDSNNNTGHLESKYSSWLNIIDKDKFPSVYSRIIVVGSCRLGNDGEDMFVMSDFSNAGERVDVFAPGEQIFSTIDEESYTDEMSGTSMAAPHVAGVAAMVWSANNTLTGVEVKDIIVKKPRADFDGFRVVDAERSVAEALDIEPWYEQVDNDKGCLFGFVEEKERMELFNGRLKPAKVQDALVTIKNKDTEEEFTATTDDNGHYELYAPPGKYYLTVECKEYKPFEWPGKLSFLNTVTVTGNYVEYLKTIQLEPLNDEKPKYIPEDGKIYTSNDLEKYLSGEHGDFGLGELQFGEYSFKDLDFGTAFGKVKAWTYHDGHYYAVFDHAISSKFMSAMITSKNSDVHLVTITDADEQELVENLIFYGERDIYYTGGFVDDSGKVYTVNDEPTEYSHWQDGYPNSYGQEGLDDVIAVFRGSGENPRSSADFGYWLEVPENEYSLLDFTDIELTEVSRGIILEWE